MQQISDATDDNRSNRIRVGTGSGSKLQQDTWWMRNVAVHRLIHLQRIHQVGKLEHRMAWRGLRVGRRYLCGALLTFFLLPYSCRIAIKTAEGGFQATESARCLDAKCDKND